MCPYRTLGRLGGGPLLALKLAWITSPAASGLPAGDSISESEATLPVRLGVVTAALFVPCLKDSFSG